MFFWQWSNFGVVLRVVVCKGFFGGHFARQDVGGTAPDYHMMVKEPVDLKTARVKLDGLRTYTPNQHVLEDISLVSLQPS